MDQNAYKKILCTVGVQIVAIVFYENSKLQHDPPVIVVSMRHRESQSSSRIVYCADCIALPFRIAMSDHAARVQWQVEYAFRGVPYWWDYPCDISESIDHASTANELVEWTWCWGAGVGDMDTDAAINVDGVNNPNLSHFMLDPILRIQTNRINGFMRKMRRALVS